MPTIELTKRAIDALKPALDRFTVWDPELSGFGVRVTPNGRRTYVLKYRINGEQRWFTIGRHGSPWTPKEARLEAQRLLWEVARGFDPADKRNADRKAIRFADLCDLYLAEGTGHKKPKTLQSDRSRITLHLKPLLGDTRVDVIVRADIERMQADVSHGKTSPSNNKQRPGGPGAAGQCVALASAVLQFAVDRGLRPDNPAKGVKKAPVRKMTRFLSTDELGRLGEALASEPNIYVASAIRLLTLTGCRLGEILELHWTDVDLERRVLNLRDSKTREKVVYLSPTAVRVLAGLPRIIDNPYVIAGSRKGRPAGIDHAWDALRARAGLAGVRIHDLRHSYASVGAAGGYGLPVIGKLLGHTQASTTARYAHLDADPLRRASDDIGETIASALEGASR